MLHTKNQVGKLNNRAFSLVELIVVIAIMSVMVGLVSVGVSLAFSRDAEMVAEQIDDCMSETRMTTMSKAGKYAMRIQLDSGEVKGISIVSAINSETTPADYKSYSVQKKANAQCIGTLADPSSIDSGVQIEFDAANGSVLYVGAYRDTLGAAVASAPTGVYQFKVSSRGKEEIVSLVVGTGRHYLE